MPKASAVVFCSVCHCNFKAKIAATLFVKIPADFCRKVGLEIFDKAELFSEQVCS